MIFSFPHVSKRSISIYLHATMNKKLLLYLIRVFIDKLVHSGYLYSKSVCFSFLVIYLKIEHQ